MSGAHREGRSRAPRRKRLSAGILLYRQVPAGTEVLLAHPGGPWFARRDAGAWTIPKGEPDAGDPDDGDDDERLLAVALREFELFADIFAVGRSVYIEGLTAEL